MKNRLQELVINISAIGVLVSLMISLGVIGVRLVAPKAQSLGQPTTLEIVQVIVKPGDTLWSIAKTQVPGTDPRDVVGNMRALNQLSSAEIFPGQVLKIQVQAELESSRYAQQSLN